MKRGNPKDQGIIPDTDITTLKNEGLSIGAKDHIRMIFPMLMFGMPALSSMVNFVEPNAFFCLYVLWCQRRLSSSRLLYHLCFGRWIPTQNDSIFWWVFPIGECKGRSNWSRENRGNERHRYIFSYSGRSTSAWSYHWYHAHGLSMPFEEFFHPSKINDSERKFGEDFRKTSLNQVHIWHFTTTTIDRQHWQMESLGSSYVYPSCWLESVVRISDSWVKMTMVSYPTVSWSYDFFMIIGMMMKTFIDRSFVFSIVTAPIFPKESNLMTISTHTHIHFPLQCKKFGRLHWLSNFLFESFPGFL